jgi:DNA invertase Pin-like site-specific DNA recombinase
LEAQRQAILAFAEEHNLEVLEIVREDASGKLGLDERPVLRQAIARCLKLKATLLVSKLDRLSRHAVFILNLMETRAKFIVAQFGMDADAFMVHIYAVLGEKERKMISERTAAALQTLKAKGKVLGNQTNIESARELAADAVRNQNEAVNQPHAGLWNEFPCHRSRVQ